MAVPQVVIVGRPNVGKSSIFNWLAKKRLAIVDDYAGVTRDRVTTLIEHNERYFELVDTGGMGIDDVDNLTAEVRGQIDAAIDSADILLLVVDARTGVVPLDEEATERLRRVNVPVILVVNKVDHDGLVIEADQFLRLGRGHMIPVSTQQSRGREELLDLIFERLPPASEEIEEPRMKVAIVGRRNVGKSTFINTLVKAERMIVSEVPGTTRDSVDVAFELDGQRFMAIDTPGLRRRRAVRTDLEFYSTHRAQAAPRADVVLMFFDATEKTSKVDKQLVQYIIENHKPVIFVVNKWDQLQGQIPTERWVHYLRHQFTTLQYAPIAFITGKTGKNVKALLNHAQMLYKQARNRVTTGQLNRLVHAALQRTPPPMYQNRRPKIYFATQVSSEPPTIVLMCNDPDGFANDYRRYLLGVMRDHLPFGEVPIKLFFEKRSHGDSDAAKAGTSSSEQNS